MTTHATIISLGAKSPWTAWKIPWNGEKSSFADTVRQVERAVSTLGPAYRACYDAVIKNIANEHNQKYVDQEFDPYYDPTNIAKSQEATSAGEQNNEEKSFEIKTNIKGLDRQTKAKLKSKNSEISALLTQINVLRAQAKEILPEVDPATLEQQTESKKHKDDNAAKNIYHQLCAALAHVIVQFGNDHILNVLDNWQQGQTPPVSDADGIAQWQELRRRYTTKTVTGKVSLYAEYNSGVLTLGSCDNDIQLYVKKFNYQKKLVEASGIRLDDDIHTHLFLQGIEGPPPGGQGGPFQDTITTVTTQKRLGEDKWTFEEVQKQILDVAAVKGLDNVAKHGFSARTESDSKPYRANSTIHPVYKVNVARPPKGQCFNCGKRHKGAWYTCKGPCGHCGMTNHLRATCRKNPLRYLPPWQQSHSHEVSSNIKAGSAGEDKSYYEKRMSLAKTRATNTKPSGGKQITVEAIAQALMKKFQVKAASKEKEQKTANTAEGKAMTIEDIMDAFAGIAVISDSAIGERISNSRPAAFAASTEENGYITADSGANWSFTNDKALFNSGYATKSGRVTGIAGKPIPIVGEGRVGCIPRFQYTPDMVRPLLAMWDLLHCRPNHKQQILLTDEGIHIRDAPDEMDPSWGDSIGVVRDKFWWVSMNWLKSRSAVTKRPTWNPESVHESTPKQCRQVFLCDVREKDPGVLIHNRYMHRDIKPLIIAQKKGVINMGIPMQLLEKTEGVGACWGCGVGQPAKKPKPKQGKGRAMPNEAFEVMGMDIKTPNLPIGYDGTLHYLHLVCVYSRGVWAYGMPRRTGAEIKRCLEDFVTNWVKRYRPHALKGGVTFFCLRSDNARELRMGEVRAYLNEIGCCERESTCVDTSYQNGAAERSIRTLCQMARATMLQRNVPQHLHPLAMKHAMHLQLQLPNASLVHLDGRRLTPMHILTGKLDMTIDLSNYRTFWAPCFSIQHEDDRKRSETFKPIADYRFYVGYQWGTKGHLLVEPCKFPAQPVVHGPVPNEQVYFVENINEEARLRLQHSLATRTVSMGGDASRPVLASNDDGHILILRLTKQRPHVVASNQDAARMLSTGEQGGSSSSTATTPKMSATSSPSTAGSAPSSEISLLPVSTMDALGAVLEHDRGHPHDMTMDDYISSDIANPQMVGMVGTSDGYGVPQAQLGKVLDVFTPQNVRQALSCDDRDKWHSSIKEEYTKLFQRGGLRFERPSLNAQWINPVLVFKVKSQRGQITRYKTRLCGDGSRQIQGRHYHESWAPCVKSSTVRTLLALTVLYSYESWQIDAVLAYLNGMLSEDLELYLRDPPLLSVPAGMAVRIVGALYGLKQAGHLWYKALVKVLLDPKLCNLTRSTWDACLFFRRDSRGIVLLTIHVDDGKLVGAPAILLQEVVNMIAKHFEITFTKEVQDYLGLEITRSEDGNIITVGGKAYIDKLQQAFNLPNEVRMAQMPHVPSQARQFAQDEQQPLDDKTPYAEAVGGLTWPANQWRPDVAFVAQRAAQFLKKPSKLAWSACKQAIRYLIATKHLGLRFEKGPPADSKHKLQLRVWSDTDHAGERPSFRTTRSYLIKLNDCLVDWGSKLIRASIVGGPVAEAVGVFEATVDALVLRDMLLEMSFDVDPVVIVYCDCASVLQAVTKLNSKMKRHEGTRLSKLQNWIEEGILSLRKIVGKDNPADLGTKGTIPVDTYHVLRQEIVGDTRLH